MNDQDQHQHQQPLTKLTVLLKSALIGSIRSMSALPFQHPFDALKTNMQAHQTNLLNSVQNIYNKKGWKGFYNGFNINLIRVMIKQAYRWPLWISTQSFYKNLLPESYQVIRQTATGITISFLQLVIVCPFERIKVWLMTTKTQSQSKMKIYYQQKFSIKDLYTGFVAQLVKQGLSWSSFLVTTQVMKNFAKQYKGTDILTATDLFLLSIPVAIVNTLFIMPIDCIKTFYQRFEQLPDKNKSSFMSMAKNMINKYGLKGLYLGWSARMIQYMIQSSYTLIAFDQLARLYEKASKKIN